MTEGVQIVIYPVNDLAAAKARFTALLGVEPYADAPYYVGYKVAGQDIGLDPNGHRAGAVGYVAVTDIKARLQSLLDAGAEEVNDLGESFEVVSEPTDLIAARTALQDAGIDYDSADVAFLPSVEIDLDEEQARRVFRLIDALEDSDDVQDVYANYSVSDDIMEKLS